MAERGTGAIVNVASVNAFFRPDSAAIDYGAAKVALIKLTKTLSQEFRPRGQRQCKSPGAFSTAQTHAWPTASPAHRVAKPADPSQLSQSSAP